MTEQLSRRALNRFMVLDLTRFRAGPTAARQFADWGANVIKIEAPVVSNRSSEHDPVRSRHSPDFQNLHRNKRSLTLNLKSQEGLGIFRQLSDKADVIIENYRPEVKYRLGIDYETLRKTNQKLVYASISGFGQSGSYRSRPGFDQIAQGMGGLMSITGTPGNGPMRTGIPIADLSAGLYCAIGILVALLEREMSGEGQWVQSSLLQAQISMLDFQAARWLINKELPVQAGNDHPTSIPTGVYTTADGFINIATSGGEIYERLCKTLGASDLINDPQYATGDARSRNRENLNIRLNKITEKKKSSELIKLLNDAGVPCGPINNIKELFEDPQVRELEMATPVDHPLLGLMNIVGQAASLSRTPFHVHSATPEQGQHTEEILNELQLTNYDISSLRERGIV